MIQLILASSPSAFSVVADLTHTDPQRPNVLFIFLMIMAGETVVSWDPTSTKRQTSMRLRTDGMIFTNAYSAAANCAPARACLLSGQYTPRHEIYNVGTAASR